MFVYIKKNVQDEDVPPDEAIPCAVDEVEGIEIYAAYFDKDTGFIHRYKSRLLTFHFGIVGRATEVREWEESIVDLRKVIFYQPTTTEDARKQLEYAVNKAADALRQWPYVNKIDAITVHPYVWQQINRFVVR